MRYFSKNFSSLIESMKSESTLTEKVRGGERTASGEKVKKIERKQDRFEKKFASGGKFNMNSFINALELLRDQLFAELTSILNTSKSGSYGAKYTREVLGSMDSLKTNVLDLIKTAYDTSKKSGKELDVNNERVETFRSQYSEYVEKYEELSSKWEELQTKDIKERPVDQANKDLEDKIKEAKSLFDKAKNFLIQSSLSVVQGPGKPSTSTIGEAELEATIKQRKEAYTGKEADIIKEVKKLIYDKFKKYDQLTSSSDWKIVFSEKNMGSPTLRANTANIIKAIKAGLAKSNPELASDKTGDITKAFIKALTELKENISIIESNKIISFDAFMEARITEQFDVEAAAGVLKTKPAAPAAPAAEEKEEDKDKDKEEKKKEEELTEDSAKKMAEDADELLISANDKIQSFYANSENFTEFKRANDDEEEAVKYIFGNGYNDKTSWWYKNIRRKYTTPVYKTINKLKKEGDKYEEYYIHLDGAMKKVISLYGILKKKTYGDTSNDKHKWSYTNLDGEKSNYSVDTDF